MGTQAPNQEDVRHETEDEETVGLVEVGGAFILLGIFWFLCINDTRTKLNLFFLASSCVINSMTLISLLTPPEPTLVRA
ncbi:hypothetical protein HDU97_004000 [Phlyctochytrium planicorne]|nr:hypothetical protein HDU97_004000 [Phlyctochytrium planicorne]